MGRTCGEPNEIKKNTHPKNITALFFWPCYAAGTDAAGEGNRTAHYRLMPQYHYAKQLRQAFDIGCVMRSSTANSTAHPGMTWTYGRKSTVNAAIGR